MYAWPSLAVPPPPPQLVRNRRCSAICCAPLFAWRCASLSKYKTTLWFRNNWFIHLSNYTLLQNRRGRWFREPPPPPRSFENRWRNIDILYIILKGILWRFRFNLNFSKIFWFLEMTPQWLQNGCWKKFQTFKIWTYYIIIVIIIIIIIIRIQRIITSADVN